MNYREETGTVTKLKGDKALVQMDVESNSACKACGGGCSRAADGVRVMQVDRDGLQVGDRVRIKVPQRSGYLGMLFIFVLPMAFFVGGMLAGTQLESGRGHGMLPILGGVGGLAAAFAIAWIVERILSSRAPLEVQRVSQV